MAAKEPLYCDPVLCHNVPSVLIEYTIEPRNTPEYVSRRCLLLCEECFEEWVECEPAASYAARRVVPGETIVLPDGHKVRIE